MTTETPIQEVRPILRAGLAKLSDDPVACAAVEKDLLKAIAVSLMADGYTFNLAANALGVPESTLRTWSKQDPAFMEEVKRADRHKRAWLIGSLRKCVEAQLDQGKDVGRAGAILANLWVPELRSSKVDVTTKGEPDPELVKRSMLNMLARGEH